MFSLNLDNKTIEKALWKLENASQEDVKRARKSISHKLRKHLKDVKAITPEATGKMKKSIGLRSSYSKKKGILAWRIVYNTKKAPHASYVNFAKLSQHYRFLTDYVEKNKEHIELVVEDAIIKAVFEKI